VFSEVFSEGFSEGVFCVADRAAAGHVPTVLGEALPSARRSDHSPSISVRQKSVAVSRETAGSPAVTPVAARESTHSNPEEAEFTAGIAPSCFFQGAELHARPHELVR
jgi:hypothetical protein